MNPQHKLYDFEVAPPVGVWEHIAAELDELNEYKTVSQKLQHIQISPPASLWNNIKNELEEGQSFEIIARKLSNVQVPPPVMAWTNIQRQLDGEKKTARVIPIKSSRSRWVRYAVAACVVGLLGILGYYLSVNSSKDVAIIKEGIAKNNTETAPPPTDSKTIQPVAPKAAANAPATAKSQSEGIVAAMPSPVVKTGNMYAPTIEKNEEIQGRYIMLMTENGDVVRLAKRLKGIADCIAGEDNSIDCNQQIAQWQEQMVKTPLPSTPDNFLDILELANKENGL